MKTYKITWLTRYGKLETKEIAMNLKHALKKSNYFEKKTGYELISIILAEDETEEQI